MKQSELRKIIREEVQKVLSEENTTIFPVNMKIAKRFGMDIEELQDDCESRYNLGKYEEGTDYNWSFERGDDFPNGIEVINKSMVADPKIKELIIFLKKGA